MRSRGGTNRTGDGTNGSQRKPIIICSDTYVPPPTQHDGGAHNRRHLLLIYIRWRDEPYARPHMRMVLCHCSSIRSPKITYQVPKVACRQSDKLESHRNTLNVCGKVHDGVNGSRTPAKVSVMPNLPARGTESRTGKPLP